MIKKLVSACLLAALAISAFAACSPGKAMEIGDVSTESFDLSEDEGSAVFTSGSNYISEALFNYLYLYFKDSFLSQALYYEAMGVTVTGESGVSVGDTEEFWNTRFSTDENGDTVAMKDYVYQNAFNVAKDVLALEKVASDYRFVFPDDYRQDLEAAIYEDINTNGSYYLDGADDFADEDGTVYEWAKARRETYLASKGITAEEWERVFFLYRTVFANGIMQHLESIGAIEAAPDEEIERTAREALEEQLKSFLEEYVKVDILFYGFKSDDDLSAEESGESSGDESGGDEDSEAPLTAEEYNARLKEQCEDIRAKLADGTLSYKDESGNAGTADEDAIVDKETLEELFGEEAAKAEDGDVRLYEVETGIYVLIYKELTDDDFGRTTVPTDDELETARNDSLQDSLNEFLKKYNEAVQVNEDALAKYDRPWEIN